MQVIGLQGMQSPRAQMHGFVSCIMYIVNCK